MFVAFLSLFMNTKKFQKRSKMTTKKLKNPFSRHKKNQTKQRNIFTFLHYHTNAYEYSQEPNLKCQQFNSMRNICPRKKHHKHTNKQTFQYTRFPPSWTIDFSICAIIRLSERNTKQNKTNYYYTCITKMKMMNKYDKCVRKTHLFFLSISIYIGIPFLSVIVELIKLNNNE